MATTRPRERILDAATRLFADEGINATSVDRVIAEADVAPMTVYRQFGGKDELVAATLERWSERWLAWLRDESWTGDEERAAAGARLESLWDALEKWFADEGFRGSYGDNVATELRAKPGHPAQAAIAAHRATPAPAAVRHRQRGRRAPAGGRRPPAPHPDRRGHGRRRARPPAGRAASARTMAAAVLAGPRALAGR